MTAPLPSATRETPVFSTSEASGYSIAELDASCRAPVLVLFTAAAAWLVLGALFALVSAIKAHAPGFLAALAELTFGRVRPVGLDALVYGFILQAGMGMTLWMSCRLGKNPLQGPRAILAGVVVWNIGLLLGLGLILAGDSSGYEWLEIPRGAASILFCAYTLMGAWALITFHYRRVRSLYVSQWFLMAALLWFPWVFSTAILLLLYFPGRGVLQTVVAGWFRHNLFELCLGTLGLASIFYFLPKLRRRPLYSEQLAMCGFWMLVFFGGWGGLHMGLPVPSWISGVSDVSRVLLLIPALAFGMSWFHTQKSASAAADPVLRFIGVSAFCYLAGAVLAAVSVLPSINRVTLFTLYDQGLMQLQIHGFLAMALAAAIYYAAPRLAARPWPSPRLIQFHFWCGVLGTAMMVLALVGGGLIQGVRLDQPKTEFIQIARSMLPFLGTSTLGATILLVGYAVLLFHLGWLLRTCCGCSMSFLSRIRNPDKVLRNGGRS